VLALPLAGSEAFGAVGSPDNDGSELPLAPKDGSGVVDWELPLAGREASGVDGNPLRDGSPLDPAPGKTEAALLGDELAVPPKDGSGVGEDPDKDESGLAPLAGKEVPGVAGDPDAGEEEGALELPSPHKDGSGLVPLVCKEASGVLGRELALPKEGSVEPVTGEEASGEDPDGVAARFCRQFCSNMFDCFTPRQTLGLERIGSTYLPMHQNRVRMTH